MLNELKRMYNLYMLANKKYLIYCSVLKRENEIFIFFPFYYIHLKRSKTLDHILHKIRKHFKLHLHALSIDAR